MAGLIRLQLGSRPAIPGHLPVLAGPRSRIAASCNLRGGAASSFAAAPSAGGRPPPPPQSRLGNGNGGGAEGDENSAGRQLQASFKVFSADFSRTVILLVLAMGGLFLALKVIVKDFTTGLETAARGVAVQMPADSTKPSVLEAAAAVHGKYVERGLAAAVVHGEYVERGLVKGGESMGQSIGLGLVSVALAVAAAAMWRRGGG